MKLVKRVVLTSKKDQILTSAYFLVADDFRSPGSKTIKELITTVPELFYNPDFMTTTNRVSFEVLADEPNLNPEVFADKYPEYFI